MRIVLLTLAALAVLAAPALAADAPPVSLESLLTVLIPAVLTPLAMVATEQLKVWMPRLLAYKVAKLLAPGALYAVAVWLGTVAEVYTLPGWLNLLIAPIPNILYAALRYTGWQPPSKVPASPGGPLPIPLVVLALLAAGLLAPSAALALTATPNGAEYVVDYDEPTGKGGDLPGGPFPLDDLVETRVRYSIDGAAPVVCATVPATRPEGGGHITVPCLVPLVAPIEATVSIDAVAVDDGTPTPNISKPSAPDVKDYDTLPTDPPN